MARDKQYREDSARLAVLIEKYTNIPQDRVYQFVMEHTAENLLPYANKICKTETQRQKLNALFEFKNLYEMVKSAGDRIYQLDSPDTAMDYFKNYFADKKDREHFAVTYLDTQLQVIKTETISDGTVGQAQVYPREIIKEALFLNARGVMLSHNHPSGDLEPSLQDIAITVRIKQGMETMGLGLFDHIIVGGDKAVSLSNMGKIPDKTLLTGLSKAGIPLSENRKEYGQPTEPKSNKRSSLDRTKELTDRLEAGMKELFQSDKYKDYLKMMSQFHNYSSRNILLIKMQYPGATRVASYNLWKEKFNRQVKKGEQGIRIFAPIKDKEPEKKLMEKLDPETGAPLLDASGRVIMEEMTALTGGVKFKLVPVFDVSQTYGDPLPELAEDLTGNVDHYTAFMDAMKEVSPLPIVFEPLRDSQDGYCRYGEKIGIRESMSEAQTVSAVIHEITHARLHDKSIAANKAVEKSKTVKEIEAESVAYVVAQHFYVETSPNSFGYLAEYGSRNMSELKASLDTIRKEANNLISAIDDRFSAICKERGIDLTAKEAEKPAAPVKLSEPEFTTETRTETVAGVEFEVTEIIPRTPEADIEAETGTDADTLERMNYQKFAELFPQAASGEYSYQHLEAGGGFEPLSIEWLNSFQISVMHTYTQNGDLCYDPMIVYEIDKNSGTLTAVEFEQSNPPLYQVKEADGRWCCVDGNDNEKYAWGLQKSINEFTTQWLNNISQQGYMPVMAKTKINGEITEINFDKDGKPVLPETETQDATVGQAAKAPPDMSTDETMPDPAISVSEMNIYGYQQDGMLPLTKEKALELYDKDHPVYLLYPGNTEGMAFDRNEIEQFDGIFGIERDEWERTLEYTATAAKNSEAAKESGIISGNSDTFGIYQLKDIEELRYHCFASLAQLEADHLAVDRSNYELAYTAPLPPKETLDDIYRRFNSEHPKDFTGRSLSVCDVVVIQRGGEVTSHYVDNSGFVDLPSFLGNERHQEATAAPASPTAQGDDADKKPAPDIVTMPVLPKAKNQPVYKQPVEVARQNDELVDWRQSRKLNSECAEAIDKEIVA